MSKKVIPKRIYVILDNVVLSKVFLEINYLKHCKRLKDIEIVPEKNFGLHIKDIFLFLASGIFLNLKRTFVWIYRK